MKLICLVKFIPDVENLKYDYDNNVIIRENVKLILNPDDASALALALKLKDMKQNINVEVVSMAPLNVIPYMEDLLRIRVDRATLITDKMYVGSDTFVTSKIIARYLQDTEFDCILTGTHSLDGDTAHVPSQIADILKVRQMSNIVKVYEESFSKESVVVEVDSEKEYCKYLVELPAILSIQKESKYKLPFIKYKDLGLDVRDKLYIITNEQLNFNKNEVGIEGSLTKVSRTFVKKNNKKQKFLLRVDEDGIETVFQFLRDKGFV
mgnify:CR=1 FL=1